ncbi:MAG: hypothetical protein AAGA86_00020 [Bacteroidota bacterium]
MKWLGHKLWHTVKTHGQEANIPWDSTFTSQTLIMNVLDFLNSDLIFPMLALLVVVLYLVQRIRNRRRYKR